MKEIGIRKEIEVVRLFLRGLPYGEIAQKVGIAKGSVVYIINDFKEGSLSIPPDVTEYVDALRQLVVDLRKHNTGIAQAKSLLKLEVKLKEMGVSSEQAEQWLDICQNISSAAVSSRQFVDAALELARLSAAKGLGYEALLADYEAKLRELSQMDKEIEQKRNDLNGIKQENGRITGQLDSITKAMATTQEALRKQKDRLKSELDEYLTHTSLSWSKIKLVESVVNSGLGKAGLTKTQIEEMRELIVATGSLSQLTNKLERRRDKLQSKVHVLAKAEKSYSDSMDQLWDSEQALDKSLDEKHSEERQLDARLESKRAELAKVEEQMAGKVEDLYICHLLLDFLAAPNKISDYDFDRLVSVMIALRHNRLGIEPRRVTGRSGNVICECEVPKVDSGAYAEKVDIDEAREVLALYLAPLVRDKFVSRFECDLAEMKHEISQKIAVVRATFEATQEERRRHII